VWTEPDLVRVGERPFSFVTPKGSMTRMTSMTTFDEQVAAAEPWFTCLRFAGMVRL